MKPIFCFYSQFNNFLPRTAIEREQKQFIKIAFAVHLSAAISAERYRSDSGALKSAVLHFVFFMIIINKIQQPAKRNSLLNNPTDRTFENRRSRYKEPSKNKLESRLGRKLTKQEEEKWHREMDTYKKDKITTDNKNPSFSDEELRDAAEDALGDNLNVDD